MASDQRQRDFSAYEESNYPGMIIPEMFNNSQDIGDGFPGLQGAIRNWTTWWLHSGNMDSGLHLAGYDITGVNLLYADRMETDLIHDGNLTGLDGTISGYKIVSMLTGVIVRGIISPRQSDVAPFSSGSQEGELYWDENDETMYRWDDTAETWIEVGT
jgi:hypothetical protein